MTIDEPRQDHLAARIHHLTRLAMLLLQVLGLADGDDPVACNRQRAVAKHAPLAVHRDQPVRSVNEEIRHVRQERKLLGPVLLMSSSESRIRPLAVLWNQSD